MKVTTFILENPEYERINKEQFVCVNAIFSVPILCAYAVHHAELKLNESISVDEINRQADFSVKNDKIILFNVENYTGLGHTGGLLTVYYAGIKDYCLLFPYVEDLSLQKRLGDFAQEAESAFESQSWMSYVLMVGAVVEGILFNQFGDKNFFKLITLADENGIIESSEVQLFDQVREMRNRVHASRHDEPFADRKIAMELSVTYERLLKRKWNND
jgi:hypothetical protein